MPKSLVLEILDFVKGSPETMDYGKWGALNPEQRHLIKKLCESWLILDEASTEQQKRIDKAISFIEPKGWIKYNKTYRERKMLEILRGEKEV